MSFSFLEKADTEVLLRFKRFCGFFSSTFQELNFMIKLRFQSVLNYVPRVPSCPTCLKFLRACLPSCLCFLRAFIFFTCVTCTCLTCIPFFTCLTCLHFFTCQTCLHFFPIFDVPYVASHFYKMRNNP